MKARLRFITKGKIASFDQPTEPHEMRMHSSVPSKAYRHAYNLWTGQIWEGNRTNLGYQTGQIREGNPTDLGSEPKRNRPVLFKGDNRLRKQNFDPRDHSSPGSPAKG